MKNTVKQAIASAVQNYIDLHDINQAIVSRRSNVPKEHLSNILKGVFTYNAGNDKVGDIPEKHFKSLAELVEYEIEKKLWATQPTDQLTQMLAILEEAKDEAFTRVIIGVTGSGKSKTIDLYKRKNPADVFSVKVGHTDTLKDLLWKVAEALRVPKRTQKSQQIRDISLTLKALWHKGRKPQLIFDESEYMKTSALCSIKEFYDHLDKYCSIVLIGTEQLIKEIDKLRRRDAKGIPQLYRRIKFGIRRLPTIDRTFSLFLKDVKDKKLVRWLQDNCANYGELHDVLVPSMLEADRLGQPLTLGLVKQVLNLPDYAA
ncbi:AAA family ATPase [Tenacibaculum aestuarii]|uniref:AAA family ATPase n=1 Tax=Tenacibaculum aestuarii TaxID=362781 RepID=UPI003895B352